MNIWYYRAGHIDALCQKMKIALSSSGNNQLSWSQTILVTSLWGWEDSMNSPLWIDWYLICTRLFVLVFFVGFGFVASYIPKQQPTTETINNEAITGWERLTAARQALTKQQGGMSCFVLFVFYLAHVVSWADTMQPPNTAIIEYLEHHNTFRWHDVLLCNFHSANPSSDLSPLPVANDIFSNWSGMWMPISGSNYTLYQSISIHRATNRNVTQWNMNSSLLQSTFFFSSLVVSDSGSQVETRSCPLEEVFSC